MSDFETRRHDAEQHTFEQYLEQYGVPKTCVNPDCPKLASKRPDPCVQFVALPDSDCFCGWCSHEMFAEWDAPEISQVAA